MALVGRVLHHRRLCWDFPPEYKEHIISFILRLALQINGGRQLSGILRGYDPFMNLVIDEAIEKKKTGEQQQVY